MKNIKETTNNECVKQMLNTSEQRISELEDRFETTTQNSSWRD